MVELLAALGRTMGFSLAAGINLYATVAITRNLVLIYRKKRELARGFGVSPNPTP